MFIVAVTGGISTGKSFVSNIFKEHGISVIDADTMARKVVEPGRKAWYKIKKEFGDDVFHSDGQLNREALGSLIFDDLNKRIILNKITHPEIYKEMALEAIRCLFRGEKFIVMDLPLLFESGKMITFMHKIIVVDCEKENQLSRLMARGEGMSKSAALSRIDAQMPLEQKCERAHFVVNNSGTLEETREQVERIISVLQRSRAYWRLRLILISLIASVLLLVRTFIFSR